MSPTTVRLFDRKGMSMEQKKSGEVILFPEYEDLKEEVEKLRTELSMLVLERDELQFVECRNLEMAYLLALGSLEYRIYEAQCTLLRQKRKMELIQARQNRQEHVVLSEIAQILDREFLSYQKKLEEQMEKMNDAIQRSQAEALSDEEAMELKRRYRRIVKALHPDLHPNLMPEQLRLFQNAVAAYEHGDLAVMRVIDEMLSEPILPDKGWDAMRQLAEERKRLSVLLKQLRKSIQNIKSTYPYTVKELLQNSEWMEQRKRELHEILFQYQERIGEYQARIQEMLR